MKMIDRDRVGIDDLIAYAIAFVCGAALFARGDNVAGTFVLFMLTVACWLRWGRRS